MAPTLTLVLLWLGFAGSHLVLSSLPVRQAMVARIGEGPFRGLYSLVAFAFFIPLVRTYFGHKHAGPALWMLTPGPALRWAMYVGMGVARSEEHTSELQSHSDLVCRLLLEKKRFRGRPSVG